MRINSLRKRSLRTFLNTTACIVAVTAFSQDGFAAPDGALIVGGTALVNQSGNETHITQSTDRAIIRWNSFDVGQNEKVRFQQPSSQSITVNRIADTKISRIDGEITANGKVVMINPNGIAFGATSKVDVNSLVATSTDLENDVAFLDGSPAKFTRSGNADAKITNAGTITARDAGLVGLVAPHVENSGTIDAKLGRVQLVSGDIHTLDFAGDGLIQLEVSDKILSQTIKNTGTLRADGGDVVLTAAQGRAALDAIISNHGRIQTGTVYAGGGQATKKGSVTISAPTMTATKSKIIEGGTIVAEGGKVQIIANHVSIEITANISVASDTGGGEILIGGAKQGQNSHPTANMLDVASGSILDASALKEGNGGDIILWSNELTNFNGTILSKGGETSGNGGFVEVSGKNRLNYKGFVDLTAQHGKTGTLLLDPTDIVISAALDANVTGTSPFTPDIDDGPSVLNVSTLTTALASASVVVQTRATGSQAGNITVSAPIAWGSGNTLTLDAHNNILINQAITGQNLTLIAGGDVQASAALTGSGLLTISQANDIQSFGIGTASVGTLKLTATDLGNITNGWSQIILGRMTGTALMDVRATTWNDNLLLRNSGVIQISGAQNLGANNLSITTNSDLAISAAVTGTGTFSVSNITPSVAIGLGTGQSGAVALNNSEIGFITNGWSGLEFGASSMTGDINVGALTWNDNLSLKTGSGILSINGNQTMGANNLTLEADSNPVIAGNITGTGILTLNPGTANLSVGLGAGASGTFNLDATELSRIQDGWSQINLGRADGTGAIDLRAATWLDPIRVYSGTGIISINGVQNFGANLGTFQTDSDLALNANLFGTGTLAFLTNLTGTSFGLAGGAGVFNLSAAELNRIQNGFSLIQFGSTVAPFDNAMTIGAYTWSDNTLFSNTTGGMNFTGAQNFGANPTTIRTDSDPIFGASLTGTGTLTIEGQTASTSVGVGTGQAGMLSLNATDLGNIIDGWSDIIIGRGDAIGAINIGANTWNDNVEFRSGSGLMTVAGAQTMGANNLTLSSASDIAINAALNGTSNLTIQGATAATTMGVGTGQPGLLSLNAADLANLTNGWTNIILGRADATGTMTVGANTWNDNLELRSNSGVIAIVGVQTMGANTLTISSAGDAQINAGLTGSGTINLRGINTNTTLAVGTAQPGSFQLSNADIANITNGWTNIIIGRTDGTGAINAGALTWNDNLTYQAASGILTVSGAQTMGANTLTIATDSASVINAGLTGSGTLNLRANTVSAAMGFGNGQPGSFQFDNTDVGNITNGWSNINIGRTDGTGVITIGALTWNDNLTLNSLSSAIVIAGAQTLAANNVTFNTDGDPQINAAMNSTGTLTFQGLTDATMIGVGTGQAGALILNNTDLTNADNTWANIVIGRPTQTGVINVGGGFTLADPLTLQSTTGVITVNSNFSVGANNLTIQTDANPVINGNMAGSGTISILPMSNTTTIGIGNAQPGTISLDNAEQVRIVNGWANIIIGRTNASGDINIGGGLTWNDGLFIRTTGAVTFAGNQAFAANNLTVQTNSDPVINGNLAGTGTITIQQIANGVSMGLGDGQAGTVNLTTAELNRIPNGWGSIIFGLASSTADLNLVGYTWNDPLTLRSGSGIININGNQAFGANNLTISTDSNLNIGGTLTSTGNLLISPNGNVSMGIGTGQAGTLSLIDAELNNIVNGWASLTFGLVSSNQPVNVGAYSWNDSVTIRNGSGQMTIAGAQTLGANNLTLTTDSNLALNAALTGTGTVTIAPSGNTSMGIGTGQAGTLSLIDAELAQITNGWAGIVLGSGASNQPVNVGAYSWNDILTLRSGTGIMTIAGAQTMGSNNLTIQTDANLALNAALTGTGILTIRGFNNATTTSFGTGQVGTVNLNDAEILQITNGWTRLDFGHTAATGTLNIGAATWNDPVRFLTNTGIMTVNGAQNMAANTLEIYTNANPTFNATISGTGTFNIQGAAAGTTMGIGDGQVGTIQLSNADLAYLAAGWSNIIFGYNGMTGAMNIGSYNWQYDTTFRTGSGVVTINGSHNTGPRNMTFETNANMVLNAALQGSGTLTIRGAANGTTMGIGSGQAGTLAFTNAELGLLSDGWSNIVFGHAASTGAINIGTFTWSDPISVISNTGVITVAGIQNMASNDLRYETNANLAINAALNGTGNLTIRGAAVGTTIGINGAAGTLALSTAEIANITDGWGSVTIGRQDMTGAISLAAATWLNPTTFITRGNIAISGTQTSTETGGTSLVFVTQAGSFTNTAGAGAINPGGGRYLIYAVSPGTTTLGGLAPATTINTENYYTLPPASVGAAGNVILYGIGATKVLIIQIDNKSKVYGDAVPTLTYTYLGGLQGGDTLGAALTAVTLTAAGATVTDNAGTTRAITGSFTTGLGYTVSVTDGVLSVTKAPVAVQTSAVTRTYGAANPAFTINYIGLKNSETSAVIDTLATANTTATVLSNVGVYNITTTGAVDNNYIFNYATNTLTITKANLTVTADNLSREYGDANPALTAVYSGFLNGDTIAAIGTLPTIATTATLTTVPSAVAITVTGGLSTNYNIVGVNGNLTITKANLTITADNKTREYGDANPALTFIYGTFKNGETVAVLDSLPTITTLANVTTGSGTAAITLSGGLDNAYNYVFVNGTLTITKATLTATVQNDTREYGDPDPSYTFVYTGFKNAETAAVIDTLAVGNSGTTAFTNVGTAPIVGSGAVDNNYNFTYVNGTLTITKAFLTATADNITREYGDVNPPLTVTYTGFKNAETAAVIDTLATPSNPSTALTNPGTSAISISGASDDNYNIAYVAGVLTITKANLTVTADNKTREYGDANPVLTFTYGAFKNGHTVAVLDSLPTISTLANATTGAGSVAITLTGGLDNQYNYVYVDGVLTITSGELPIRALPSTVYYSNSLGERIDWIKWRDLIYYEDEGFLEQILFGRHTAKRRYVF